MPTESTPNSAKPLFERLLTVGAEVATFGAGHAHVEQVHLGKVLVDGRIYACDPFVPIDNQPFARLVAAGSYEVVLLVAVRSSLRYADVCPLEREVLAAAMVFSDHPPVHWDVALRDGAAAGEDSGAYAVDSGTGCLMGWHAAQRIVEGSTYSDNEHARLHSAFTADGELGGVFDIGGQQAVALFTSGSGDGIYESWWGMDEGGKAAMLLTDFGSLVPLEQLEAAVARWRARKKWWQFWK